MNKVVELLFEVCMTITPFVLAIAFVVSAD